MGLITIIRKERRSINKAFNLVLWQPRASSSIGRTVRDTNQEELFDDSCESDTVRSKK